MDTVEESPIPRIHVKGFTLGNSTPSLGEFAGSKSTVQLLLRTISTVPKSALLRGLSIAFLSLIGTQTVPGSPQFGIRCTSRSPYRFLSIAERDITRAPSKIQSLSLGRSRSPYD
ncbi:uncharacterized protein TNCV_2283281 [Trichonephila clavipes]|nr:uncharacterized protein TNCV_2283281 [Trichonephila clavipes]